MKPLETIQKRNKLNTVVVEGYAGPGGAHHHYKVFKMEDVGGQCLADIEFQNGPRNEPGNIAGILDVDLLEIVRDRLVAFQRGDFSCRENALALTHIEEALLWLNKRTEDRAARNVLGTMRK